MRVLLPEGLERKYVLERPFELPLFSFPINIQHHQIDLSFNFLFPYFRFTHQSVLFFYQIYVELLLFSFINSCFNSIKRERERETVKRI